MASYNLASAATAAGINRSTVLRAIKAGKISATKDEHGGWQIEPAELHRVYPPQPERQEAGQRDTTADSLVAELRAVIADLRADRDAWREHAQRLTLPKPRAWRFWPWRAA